QAAAERRRALARRDRPTEHQRGCRAMSHDRTSEPLERERIARPPTACERTIDQSFRWLTRIMAGFTALLVALIVILSAKQAMPAIFKFGPGFLTATKWDAGKDAFGILPQIFGTVVSSLIGVALATVFGIAMAVFLTEDFIPRWLQNV